MFSKLLIKLIDQAIVPAILVLTARLVSVAVLSNKLRAQYNLQDGEILFRNTTDFVRVNSYSVAIMFGVLALGTSYILVKALVFHNSHVSPGTTAKMFSLKLDFFIQNSFNLYTQGAIWLAYTYLLLLSTGLMALFGLVYAWVAYLGVAITLTGTILLALDIEKEMKLDQEEEDTLLVNGDTTLVLSFGEETNE